MTLTEVKRPPKNPGLLEQPLDPRDIWVDEIVGGEPTAVSSIPESFLIEDLSFESQGSQPYCASFATTKMVEYHYKKKGVDIELSQPHLYYNSGGSMWGSYFRTNLATAKNRGCIDEIKLPMPLNRWDFDADVYETYKNLALTTPFDDPKTILGYARVSTLPLDLKQAIMDHGPIMVGVYAGGGYWNPDTKRQGAVDNHATLLVGWDKDHWILFDSLQMNSEFNGYHSVSRDYTFNSAYTVLDIPENWKEIVEEKRVEPYQHCLNHYGKPRNFELETQKANELLREFKKFNNQSVLEAAGRFWTVLVNMATYADYSISYRKYGRWQPGDLINMIYAYRRTGQLIFDPNKLRNEYN